MPLSFRPGGTSGGGASSPGSPGKSAYQSWLDLGNSGTEADFVASLKGAKGNNGADSTVAGPPGPTLGRPVYVLDVGVDPASVTPAIPSGSVILRKPTGA